MENKLKRETIELYHYRRIFGQESFEKLLTQISHTGSID